MGLHRIRLRASRPVLGDLEASVQDISVDLDTDYSLKPRALGCNIVIVRLEFLAGFCLVYFSLSLRLKKLKFESTAVP